MSFSTLRVPSDIFEILICLSLIIRIVTINRVNESPFFGQSGLMHVLTYPVKSRGLYLLSTAHRDRISELRIKLEFS